MHIARALGGKFQGSNRKDFKDATDLYTIRLDPIDTFNIVPVKAGQKFRYVRYFSPPRSFGNMAEIGFYENEQGERRLLKGKVIGTKGSCHNDPKITREALFDGDPLSYFDSGKPDSTWAGLDLGSEKEVAEIRFLARNAMNRIEKGDIYELLYWDNEWISLGQKKAENNFLTFDNVPSNALFWLRDLTKGKDERIFTYDNGIQMWW
jgi:hypothetical protein